jgi:acyl carrier protein
MTHDEVLTLVREHLAEELEVDVARISETTRFREDLDADSLDLYELVMELEDRYGVVVSEEQATHIHTVGDAVGFVLEHAPALGGSSA